MRSKAPQLQNWPMASWVRELTDKELQGGFDLDDLIDKECNILMLHSKSKTGAVYSNVERAFCT